MTAIEKIVKKGERGIFVFKPDKAFYETVGIKQKRWAQLYRGQAVPNLTEMQELAKYFEVPITEFIQ